MEVSPQARKKAIIAYITIVGMFIAMSMNSDHKHFFSTQHIKNMFGLSLIWLCSQVITFYVNAYAGDCLFFVALLLTIYSLIRATQNKLPNIPIISALFVKWFTFLD